MARTETTRTDLIVTGAAGQLGRQVVQVAADAGLIVRALGSADLDITDPVATGSVIARAAGTDTVLLNCAAYTAVDAAETDEDRATAINTRGPENLAMACARAGVHLIHVSTDYVYPGDATSAYEPTDPTGPRTAYGRTKLAGEIAAQTALPTAQVVRTAWVYTGVGGDFVATMRRLEQERETLRVVDDQIGSPTFAADLAQGLVQLATTPAARSVPTLHATNSGQASWFEFARAVFEEIGADPQRVAPCSTEEFPRPAPRPAYSVLSDSVWRGAGLTPLRPWREALRAAMASIG